jgi:hypothetical protein
VAGEWRRLGGRRRRERGAGGGREERGGERKKIKIIMTCGPTVDRGLYRVWMGAGENSIEDRILMTRLKYSF